MFEVRIKNEERGAGFLIHHSSFEPRTSEPAGEGEEGGGKRAALP
jgi:hypothetical protein